MQAALQQQPLLQPQPRRCGNSSTQWPSQQLAAAGGRPCRALLHMQPASNSISSMRSSSSSTWRAQHMALAQHRQPGERGQQHPQQRLPHAAPPLGPAAAPQQQQTHQQRLAAVCRAMFGPLLSASEISRVGGLNNADLHLRQHYEEAIVWDADKEGSRVWRRTVSSSGRCGGGGGKQDERGGSGGWSLHATHAHFLALPRALRSVLSPRPACWSCR